MRLESARELKDELLKDVIEPFSVRACQLRSKGAIAVSSAAAAGGIEEGRTVFGIGARPFDTLPYIQRSVALGVARHQGEYRLAVRVQRPSLVQSALMERLTRQATGEVDVRLIGRVDKRPKTRRAARRTTEAVAAAVTPWYQRNTRPLLIGASVGLTHLKATLLF